ncbi:hypothetical protein SDC9_130708 [bioreactor metagenome]|uniref:Uncharacterized protein n=1 Tax=bioreactor metagenome TaxID=1076179 RepID=A0A645D361_9ZZZZ
MRIHLVLHVEYDSLRDPGVDIALQHRDRLRRRQSHQRPEQQPQQQRHVLARQRFVYDAPGNDGGQQSDDRRNQDCEQNQCELNTIRFQIGENAI